MSENEEQLTPEEGGIKNVVKINIQKFSNKFHKYIAGNCNTNPPSYNLIFRDPIWNRSEFERNRDWNESEMYLDSI